MSHQRSTIRRVGVAVVLAVCLALPGVIWAGPPSSNPGQPFAEILAQIGILNDKLDDLLANGNGVDLHGVTQNWDKKLDSTNGDANGCNSDRFTCIFPDATYPDGAAVRDNETGLVWERSPDVTPRKWTNAMEHCATREVGGRLGWHLPLLEQLVSLLDRTQFGPALPAGHPFLTVLSAFYWSATTDVGDPTAAWYVGFFSNGNVSPTPKDTITLHAWCVRGGQVFDGNVATSPAP